MPAFARMALVEVDAAGPDARRERDALLGSFRRFFADAGPGPALTDVDRDVLVSTVVGGIYATVRGRVAQGRAAELPQLLPVLTYAATAPFLGTEVRSGARPISPDDGPSTAAPCGPTRQLLTTRSETAAVFHFGRISQIPPNWPPTRR